MNGVVLCSTVAAYGVAPPGIARRPCSECGRPCLVAPVSLERIARLGLLVLCLECGAPWVERTAQETGVVIVPPTVEELREAAVAVDPRRN